MYIVRENNGKLFVGKPVEFNEELASKFVLASIAFRATITRGGFEQDVEWGRSKIESTISESVARTVKYNRETISYAYIFCPDEYKDGVFMCFVDRTAEAVTAAVQKIVLRQKNNDYWPLIIHLMSDSAFDFNLLAGTSPYDTLNMPSLSTMYVGCSKPAAVKANVQTPATATDALIKSHWRGEPAYLLFEKCPWVFSLTYTNYLDNAAAETLVYRQVQYLTECYGNPYIAFGGIHPTEYVNWEYNNKV